MPAQEQRLRVRDISVRYLRKGSGQPLLFLHGAGGWPGQIPFLETLASHYEVIAPEHPGFGDSDGPPWIRNVADVAMYYLDLLDELGLAGVNLIGHSLGGWIAAELAVRNCSQLAKLVLLAPAGVRVKGVPSGDNFIWSPEETARNIFYNQSFAEQMLARVPSEEEADRQLSNRFMAAKLGWEPRWFNPALERWLHRIKVPTQVIWGADDKLLPSAYSKVWAEQVPDAKLEIIPECGHLPHVEKGDVTARKIVDFLGGR